MKAYAQTPTKHKTLDRVSFTLRDMRNTQASGHAVTDLRVTLDTRECFTETSKQKMKLLLYGSIRTVFFEAFTLQFNTRFLQNPDIFCPKKLSTSFLNWL